MTLLSETANLWMQSTPPVPDPSYPGLELYHTAQQRLSNTTPEGRSLHRYPSASSASLPHYSFSPAQDPSEGLSSQPQHRKRPLELRNLQYTPGLRDDSRLLGNTPSYPNHRPREKHIQHSELEFAAHVAHSRATRYREEHTHEDWQLPTLAGAGQASSAGFAASPLALALVTDPSLTPRFYNTPQLDTDFPSANQSTLPSGARDRRDHNTPISLVLAMSGAIGTLATAIRSKPEGAARGLTNFQPHEVESIEACIGQVFLYTIRLANACNIDLPQVAKELPERAPAHSCSTGREAAGLAMSPGVHQHSKRKRFSDAQLRALTELAGKAGWSLTRVPKEERESFCRQHNITSQRLSNFMNNRKPANLKKPRLSGSGLPGASEAGNSAGLGTSEDGAVHSLASPAMGHTL